jgi:hypothetical protein
MRIRARPGAPAVGALAHAGFLGEILGRGKRTGNGCRFVFGGVGVALLGAAPGPLMDRCRKPSEANFRVWRAKGSPGGGASFEVGTPPGVVSTYPPGRAPEREGASERARPPSTNYRDSETSGLKLAFRGRSPPLRRQLPLYGVLRTSPLG